jgi:hypothetical protein
MSYQDQILFNVASQTIWVDVPEGRPTSVTSVAVYENRDGDTGTAEVATTGSASVVTSPNTVIDANSGYGQTTPRKVNVTATAGMAEGIPLLLTGAVTGETEWFEPVEVKSNDYAIARYPLHNAYVLNDTVETTRIQITIDSTWVADKNNLSDPTQASPRYRVRWVYVYASTTYVLDTYFDLLRYPRDKSLITPLDVENYMPGWLNSLPVYERENRGMRLITTATQEVADDLYNEGYPEYAPRDRDAMRPLIVRKAVVILRRANHGQDARLLDSLEDARMRYQEMLDKRIRITPKIPLTGDTAGAATTVRPVSITRR